MVQQVYVYNCVCVSVSVSVCVFHWGIQYVPPLQMGHPQLLKIHSKSGIELLVFISSFIGPIQKQGL